MMTVRARVSNGRLVLDEPTDLPEGAEVELAPVDDQPWDLIQSGVPPALPGRQPPFDISRG